MKLKQLYIFFHFSLAGMLIMTSCKNNSDKSLEMQYTDTLNSLVFNSSKALNIDEDGLRNRLIVADSWKQHFFADTQDIEIRKDYEALTALQGVYKSWLSEYMIHEQIYEENKKIMQAFEEKVESGEWGRDEFLAEYSKTKKKLEMDYFSLKRMAMPVFDVESSWIRYENRIQNFEKIKQDKKKPTLF